MKGVGAMRSMLRYLRVVVLLVLVVASLVIEHVEVTFGGPHCPFPNCVPNCTNRCCRAADGTIYDYCFTAE